MSHLATAPSFLTPANQETPSPSLQAQQALTATHTLALGAKSPITKPSFGSATASTTDRPAALVSANL